MVFFDVSSNFVIFSSVVILVSGFEAAAAACPAEGGVGVLAFATAATGFGAEAIGFGAVAFPVLLFFAEGASTFAASEANQLFKFGTGGAAAIVVAPPTR